MRVAFYISNHGLGHATRVSALVTEMVKYQIRCYVMTDRPFSLFEKLNNQFHFYRKCSIDFGVAQNTPLSINRELTFEKLKLLNNHKKQLINQETTFLKESEIDLIIADIPPLAFEIAEKANIPIYAISNFDWYTIYHDLLPDQDAYEWFKTAYQKSHKSFILPFAGQTIISCLANQQKTGLLARKSINIRKALMNKYDIPAGHKIILYALNDEIDFDYNQLLSISGIILLSKHSLKHPNYRQIDDYFSYPDLVASMDLVIAKSGYSTIAEAVQSGTYLLLFSRDENIEDKMIFEELEDYPYYQTLKFSQANDYNWSKLIINLPVKTKAIAKYKNANQAIALDILKEFFKDKNISAVLDVGTNNVLLLWASYQNNQIKVYHRANSVSALGRNIKQACISNSAITRLKKIFKEFIPPTQAITSEISVLATSCSRDARNIHLIKDWLMRKYHLAYQVISPDEEAQLNGYANCQEFPQFESFITFDIGGGSTEFTLIHNTRIVKCQSLKLGIRSLHNQFRNNLPLIHKEIKKILSQLDPAYLVYQDLVGIGGTVANLSALSQMLSHYDSGKVHNSILNLNQLNKYLNEFTKMSLDEIRLLMPFEPQRAEIISIGILIIIEIMNLFRADQIMVSDHGLMFGQIVKSHCGQEKINYEKE